MKRVYEFITKANQVLVFLVAAAVVAFIAKEIISDLLRPHRESSVPVVTSGNEQVPTPIRDVQLAGVWFDWYVFEVVKDAVGPRDSEDVLAIRDASSWSGGYPNKTVVNIVFSDGASRVRSLLPNDGLVLERRMSFVDENGREGLWWHVFRCVTEDTNRDQKLDASDRNDLHLVSRDPTRLDVVLKGVTDHKEISSSGIVYSTGEGEATRFWRLDLESSETTEVSWRRADQ